MIGNLQKNIHVLQNNTRAGLLLVTALLSPEYGRMSEDDLVLSEELDLIPEPQPQSSCLWSML